MPSLRAGSGRELPSSLLGTVGEDGMTMWTRRTSKLGSFRHRSHPTREHSSVTARGWGCLVLSPFARSGYISKSLHSHVSLVRFCESIFGLPTLTQRDAQADDMSDCFNFKRSPA